MGIYQSVQQFVSIEKKTIFFHWISIILMKKKKYIHVHVLAINTHVFLLKYMTLFIKFKIETLMNEWKIYIIYFESILSKMWTHCNKRIIGLDVMPLSVVGLVWMWIGCYSMVGGRIGFIGSWSTVWWSISPNTPTRLAMDTRMFLSCSNRSSSFSHC